ncbi:MAG TPA: DNA-binding protein WhiA [Thermoanaerobacterales bacterium]|uniref:DNA-binding protein WhiA n=1 Tax=Tepidanaerobacter sp. GT38 TaxID=2722793 RepID=UPI00183676D7|nr:DNA-binding protein WhiA [Tepidanaerobacter sp. GT38]HHY42936.1 DNA-binding protein WhiA [Thermoanaerobacterales bacterium]
MSFSYDVKEELSRQPSESCCQKAELAALVQMAGTIRIVGGEKKVLLQVQTVHPPTARRVYRLFRKNFPSPIQIAVKRNSFLKDKRLYIITIDTKYCKSLLEELGIIPQKESIELNKAIMNQNLIKKDCCKRSFLRGAFLGGGSISNPKGPYHMEFVTQDEDMAKTLIKIIDYFGLKSNVVERKTSYMIYLKDGDHISDILGLMGAHNSLLKYEDVRVLKDMRNSVNRIVNCETANLNKTIDASVRQIASINYFKENNLFDKLPEKLRQIAELRLEYPDLSLKELGQMMDPVLGKSGVSYRLKKIEDLASKLQSTKGELSNVSTKRNR